RRIVQRALDLVAPSAPGGKVVLVEEDLLLAEQRVEVPGQRGRLVGAVAGAIADENASGHRRRAASRGPNPDARVSRLLRHCVDPGRNEMDDTRRSILVVGAGDATGGAIARRFAREGLVACVTRRSADKLAPLVAQIQGEGGEAHGFASDARKELDVETLVMHIEREIAPIEVAVFNIGANVRFGIAETTERVYRKVWEMG